jgi:two-component system, response regulator YesN
MSDYKAAIEKICKLAFNFTNIDTFFIDSSSNIQVEFGYTHAPEPLREYVGNISNLINLQECNSELDALIHCTSYATNFISVKVSIADEYLGSIIIGPYLTEEPDILMIENIIFQNKLSISLKNIIKQYYLSLPLISDYKAKLIAEFISYNALNLDSICSQDINIGSKIYTNTIEYSVSQDRIKQSTEQTIALIEQRYIRENELLHAIETGNREKLYKASEEWSHIFREIPDRVPNDPLRSRKNLTFVLNTLLRKAAEKGGLHPMDIHILSEKYAIQIEQTNSIQQLIDLQDKMRLGYCDAVRKLSLKNFNYLTKKAIEFIRKNLDGDLSLEAIASSIDVSPYELSRQFKKETGHNLTEYINIQRINEAVYIMDNQNISITDIAHMVGFNDVNYFTKVFKKLKGMTPSEYRKNKK